MLRSHTSAGVPPGLRALAATRGSDAPGDVLLALPGLCYRRDTIDRLHVGTPHQVDLWRIITGGARGRLDEADLQQMIALLIDAVLPGARWRTQPAGIPTPAAACRSTCARRPAGWSSLSAAWPPSMCSPAPA